MDISVATNAGLSQSEIAKVLGVSRTTVNLWVNGKFKPHALHAERLRSRMQLLNAAIHGNMIPPRDRKRKPRHEAIAKVIDQLTNVS
jgi:transcriptional regulator with XRE-family HTH domain